MMIFASQLNSSFRIVLTAILVLLLGVSVHGQSTYTGQISGEVTDPSGAVIAGAKVTLTDVATNVQTTATTDSKGVYVLPNLRPATYTILVEAPNLASVERKDVVLAVSQQANLNFTLSPGSVTTSVTVTDQAPLLDTGNASLGTDVTNEYVRDIPLINRSFFGSGLSLPAGSPKRPVRARRTPIRPGRTLCPTDSATPRPKSALTAHLPARPNKAKARPPTSTTSLRSKSFRNSKSKTTVSRPSTAATAAPSSTLFSRKAATSFTAAAGGLGSVPRWMPTNFSGTRKEFPIRITYAISTVFRSAGRSRRQKTFFFVDFEKTREGSPVNINAFVPTAAERMGDFRNTQVICTDSSFGCALGQPTQQRIFNPFNVDANGNRADFTVPNVIDPNLIDPDWPENHQSVPAAHGSQRGSGRLQFSH